ncbi:MAG: imidazole glycerol phosphate synthase subunit HisH [Rhodospirillales bacterium]
MAATAVVDYGSGNVFSVMSALSALGAGAVRATTPDDIAAAAQIVLPGVGAFAACRRLLAEKNLDTAVLAFIETGKPFLGICVGMQMLFDGSDEFGDTPGFGVIPGRVRRIPGADTAGRPLKRPHIGWAPLRPGAGWAQSPLSVLGETSEVYFVHSYAAEPEDESHALAYVDVGGRPVCAAAVRGNVFGVQFHPEKSAACGLSVLKAFLAR